MIIYPLAGLFRFHRAVFQRCLADQLDKDVTSTHFSKRLISYTLPSPSSSSDSPITLNFADGSKATCDVLVGADGIHSATRRTLFELAAQEAAEGATVEGLKKAAQLRTLIEPSWSGAICYRALIPFERLEAINPDHSVLATFQNVRAPLSLLICGTWS